jgi:DNA-binding HxlR family transcriptional regulator
MWHMSEARWKLVVDQEGVTIAGDRFQLTTAPQQFAVDDAVFGVTESPEMEAIMSELDAMTRRTYGQYCGLARAMEVLGERWAPLVVRDLLVSPKDIAELRRGLPRVPEDVLLARLRELEHTGVIRVQEPVNGNGSAVYELTDYGRQLDDVVLRLSGWGAQMMGDPRPEDVFTANALIMTLRSVFQSERAKGVQALFELHAFDYIVHIRIDDGVLHTGIGSLGNPDLVVETGFAIKNLMTGELSPAEAINGGSFRVIGDPALFTLFANLFRLSGSETAATA